MRIISTIVFFLNALCGELKGEVIENIKSPNPSPLVQWSDFLPEVEVEKLLNYVDLHQSEFKLVGLVEKRNDKALHYDANVRNNTEIKINNISLIDRLREHIEKNLSELTRQLGLKGFEADRIEFQLRAYHHGEYFRTHADSFFNRRINFVYFFHAEPKKYTGGELVIFDTDTKKSTISNEFSRITPVCNKIVFFPSDYYHAVLPVVTPDREFMSGRFVINGHVCEKKEVGC